MYSPKISEELIPQLYQLAKARGLKMTALVNEILSNALNSPEGRASPQSNNPGESEVE